MVAQPAVAKVNVVDGIVTAACPLNGTPKFILINVVSTPAGKIPTPLLVPAVKTAGSPEVLGQTGTAKKPGVVPAATDNVAEPVDVIVMGPIQGLRGILGSNGLPISFLVQMLKFPGWLSINFFIILTQSLHLDDSSHDLLDDAFLIFIISSSLHLLLIADRGGMIDVPVGFI